ncbi:unnamed protein product [Didymodactylos carnosus]|uniref:Reverse transcriptase/retrotransposon-derived protein RNase H-like domain-containing protein n=1 Tax=Didymodactylos carnosus TaxID=1234261 RepID=A0A8S2EX53_9BILA|nr:unnamed protein product [Didymodactylos carnosus]CAF4068720.1 unnamed protein product [Didymodactylos carnosus]
MVTVDFRSPSPSLRTSIDKTMPKCIQYIETRIITSLDKCSLNQRLSQYPMLAFDDGKSKLTLKLSTDASNCSLGGVLHQVMEDGRLRPIQYLSRSLIIPREEVLNSG